MSYQVLARRWCPQTFADVIGQEHVLTALTNGLSLGRIYHVYLFSDTRGIGKTSTARLLAKGLSCETGITTTSRSMCDDYREIEQGRFVDLIEIDAVSHTEAEDTYDLLDSVQYAPACGRFKAYLIDEVHMLSRYSFSTLLKILEEPPEHVKFLLAMAGPQKLSVTILSCCPRSHLKVLGVEQIRRQLEHILNEERITREPRALQLLTRAVESGLRDALSLTNQVIASDDDQVSAQAVSAMLGTPDNGQALSLIEAMVGADDEHVIALIDEAAARGTEWEALLVEMFGLLHRIAMVQLLPVAPGNNMAAIELRMRELARTIPPTDIQLYYQTLLTGREELLYTPDRRMGIKMVLPRVLASRPRMPLPEPEVSRQSFTPVVPTAVMAPIQVPPQLQSALQQAPTVPLPETTSQALAVHQQLQRVQGATKAKKGEPVTATRVRPVSNVVLGKLASITDRVQARPMPSVLEKAPAKKETYRWKATTPVMQQKEVITTPKVLKKALGHERAPELAVKLAAEVIEHNPWAAQVNQLLLPKLVEQVTLNVQKEESDNTVCLHSCSSQRYSNDRGVQRKLVEALNMLRGSTVELTIVEDDNPAVHTSLEWCQAIYEGELVQAREPIIADSDIQTLRWFFDIELDEENIRPI